MNSLKSLFNKKQIVGWGPASAIIVTIFIFFLSQIIAGAVISIYPLLKHYNSTKTEELMNTIFTQFLLVLFVELLIIFMVERFVNHRHRTLKDLGLVRFKYRDIVHALAGFGVYFISFISITILVSIFLPSVNLDQKQQIGFQNANTNLSLLVVFISLVVLPPIAEEILCRGFLYTGLRTKFSFIKAGLITSVIFAIAHLQFGSNAPLLWVAAIDTFILSLVLVYLREKTSSLWPSIILHGLKNSIAFVYLFIIR